MHAHRIVTKEQRRGRPGDVAGGNVNVHLTCRGRSVVAASSGRKKFTLRHVHSKGDDLSLRNAFANRALWCGRIRRRDGVVAISGSRLPRWKRREFGDGGFVLRWQRSAAAAPRAGRRRVSSEQNLCA